jgi:hypothetical protein
MDTARERTALLAALLRREHDALAEFLVELAAFDHARRWAELGYASLFQFLHRELRLSLGAAQYRKVAAELIEEVPAVAEALRRGQLCFTAVVEASKVVTAGNWETVLPRFYGPSRREAAEIVAELQPHPAPPVRTVFTTVRPPTSLSESVPALSSALAEEHASPAPVVPAVSPGETVTVSSPLARATDRTEIDPLTAELRRMHVTVSKEFARKLKAAADARPDLTTEQILEAGLDLLLTRSAKARGLVARPQQNPRPSRDGGHITAHEKREVMKRSGGRCEWILPSVERCGSTHALEFHHVDARAKGGTATIDKVLVTCHGHNLLAARQDFGDEVMSHYAGAPRPPHRG